MKLLRTIGNKILNFLTLMGQARMERDRMFREAMHKHGLGR